MKGVKYFSKQLDMHVGINIQNNTRDDFGNAGKRNGV